MLFKTIDLHSQFLSLLKKSILYLAPTCCIFCKEASQRSLALCVHCQKELPILTRRCRQCAQLLPFCENKFNHEGLICGNCLKNPPVYDALFALFPYEDPVIQVITQLKFRQQLFHVKLMGKQMLSAIQKRWYINRSLPDLIIPVPLHKARLKERGFNQALELAKPLAKGLKIPLHHHSAKRIKNTQPQSELNAKERKTNIKNAFVVTQNYANLTIAVLDDVVTTGHTITEFCKTLKQQQAKRIDVWCYARR